MHATVTLHSTGFTVFAGEATKDVGNSSTYRVMEYEYMSEEEYPDVLHDYTGFMLQKYIPGAFSKFP